MNQLIEDNFKLNNDDLIIIYNYIIANKPEKITLLSNSYDYNGYDVSYNVNNIININFSILLNKSNNEVNYLKISISNKIKRSFENKNKIEQTFYNDFYNHDIKTYNNLIFIFEFLLFLLSNKNDIVLNNSFKSFLSKEIPYIDFDKKILDVYSTLKADSLLTDNDSNEVNIDNEDYFLLVDLLLLILDGFNKNKILRTVKKNKRINIFKKKNDDLQIECDFIENQTTFETSFSKFIFKNISLNDDVYFLGFKINLENHGFNNPFNKLPFELRKDFYEIHITVFNKDKSYFHNFYFYHGLHIYNKDNKTLLIINNMNNNLKKYKNYLYGNHKIIDLINLVKLETFKNNVLPFINKYEFLKEIFLKS